MKKIFCLLLLLLLLVTGCGQGSGGKDAAADGSYKVTDEHGTVTTFKQAPQKVLTLALSSDGIIMGWAWKINWLPSIIWPMIR